MGGMVAAGRVGRLFGTKGELMVTLYDVFPRDFDREEPVFVKIDSLTVPLFFNRFERRGQKGAVVSFDDIDTDERAAELIGSEFFIRENAGADDADELYLEDLVGWDAEFGGGVAGRITAFHDSEFNPLFEVEIAGCEPHGQTAELIPAQDEFIVEFDETRRRVVFSLPEGLLGLNKLT